MSLLDEGEGEGEPEEEPKDFVVLDVFDEVVVELGTAVDDEISERIALGPDA